MTMLFPPYSLPSQRNSSISFKPKVAIAKIIGKKQKKSPWYYEKWGGRHASFPPRQSVNNTTSKRISQQYELQESQYICRQIVTNRQ